MTGSSTSEKVAMELAKKMIDVGLSTNDLNPMLHFWQNDVGLRALRKQDAVVGDDSHWVTPDTGEAADQGRAVQALEFVEFASIHEARDNFSHVIRRATVGRNDGVQFPRRIARRDGPAQFNRRPLHRVQTRDDAAAAVYPAGLVLSGLEADGRRAA